MLTDEQIAERDPALLQQRLLLIEREIEQLGPELIQAKMKSTECDFKMKILKERKSAIQSALKSLGNCI